MNGGTNSWSVKTQDGSKYSRVERERRFLLDQFPVDVNVERVRRIRDRYIEGTRLRLRQECENDGPPVFKLTQKIPAPASGGQQGFITNLYLSENEFQILAPLSAREMSKTRYSVPPFGIDVFEGELEGLILAEAEFASASEAEALTVPSYVVREVSEDGRFTGGRLVRASRPEVRGWLLEYGVRLE